MSGRSDPPVVYRTGLAADRSAAVALCGSALGWRPEDPNEALFAWKHDRSAFGPSPFWVAEIDGQLVGVRVFLRWEFQDRSGQVVRAVRAVDTATHPGFQGQGIFRNLTLRALDALGADGVAFVFNTPNDQSRPGYLKMGWEVLGRVPVGVSVRSPIGVARMATARVPAGKWSVPCDVGDDARTVFGFNRVPSDGLALRNLLDASRSAPGSSLTGSTFSGPSLVTNRTDSFFAWRYADGPLSYRVLRRGRRLDDGFVVFRLRRRGRACEATICDVVHHERDNRVASELVRSVLRETGAHYAISVVPGAATRTAGSGIGAARIMGPGSAVPIPGQGPVFTWRSITRTSIPPLSTWSLRLGDIELF